MGIYIDDDPVDEIPEGNYEIDERSECTVNGEKQDIEFSYENGKLGIFGIVTKGNKCTIYLKSKNSPLDVIIATVRSEKPNVSSSSCLNGINKNPNGRCTEETNGLYKETTSLGDTYYYRGTVNNNWVKYGTSESGLPIWWRIIRINEDKTVRLIYAGEGEEAPASADQVNEQGGYWINDNYGIDNTGYKFNSSTGYNAYVGYMYGMPNSETFNAEHGYDLIDAGTVDQLQSSDIKKTIDEWYIKNLADEGNVLSGSTGFCGDRTPDDAMWKGTAYYPNLGYGKFLTYYMTSEISKYVKSDNLECPDKAHDLYTTKTDKGAGNGALIYPIGLITINELLYAGANGISSNYGYWLRTEQPYWTISVGTFLGNANVYDVSSDGYVAYSYVNSARGVRPVINVKTRYFKTENHDGTITNPYIVE